MVDKDNDENLRRKRRKIRQRHSRDVDEVAKQDNENRSKPLKQTYDFLNLAAIIIGQEVPVIFTGTTRPKNAYSLIQSGGSFLVFKEPRSVEDLVLSSPEGLWSPASNMVLKRNRIQHPNLTSQLYCDSDRYAAIMAELQILTHRSVRMHEVSST